MLFTDKLTDDDKAMMQILDMGKVEFNYCDLEYDFPKEDGDYIRMELFRRTK